LGIGGGQPGGGGGAGGEGGEGREGQRLDRIVERYEDTLIHCLGPLGFAGVVQQATAQQQPRPDPAGLPAVDAAQLAPLSACPPAGAAAGARTARGVRPGGADADRALLARCAAKVAAAQAALPEHIAGVGPIACSYAI
jgi:hypothetical protein